MSMKLSPKLKPNGWDALMAALILTLALCLGLYFWNLGRGEAALTLVLSADGEEILRIPLSTLTDTRQEVVEARGYTLRFSMNQEEVWVETSDCPTQDCVHSGHIRRGGQSIVCLPARVVAELQGGGDDGPDVVIG